jgi:hypothetical protein
MHNLIGIIVYAKNEAEALPKAQDVLNNMVGENYQPFDWGCLLTSPHARWQETYKPVYNLKHKEGRRVVGKLMKSTLDSFKYNTQRIIDAIKETNGDIAKLRAYGGFDVCCHLAGQFEGSEVHLYSDVGEGIQEIDHLKEALELEGGTETFLVLADVHY